MYTKYHPSSIFTGTEILPGENVLITKHDGTIETIVPLNEAGEDCIPLEGMLSPGFVNAHCHIELSHLKGCIPESTGLVPFLQAVMTQRNDTPEEMKVNAMRDAVRDLHATGTVAVGDICNTADSISIKRDSPLYWHNFVEITGFVDSDAATRMAGGLDLLNRFLDELGGFGFPASLAPHAPYSVSRSLFQLLNGQKGPTLTSIHNQETVAEDKLYKEKSGELIAFYARFGIDISGFQSTGKSSLQSWLPWFTESQQIISVHNTYSSDEDLEFGKQQLSYCLCPRANLYIENKLPPVESLVEKNCNIVIGTDSLASNHGLDMMAELRVLQENFPSIPFATMQQWATLNGAIALGIHNKYGSFEKGKKPAVVLINGPKAARISP